MAAFKIILYKVQLNVFVKNVGLLNESHPGDFQGISW